MAGEVPQSLFDGATSLLAHAQEIGLDSMASLREDGAIRLTDFPLTVESPNASLIIARDGTVISGHNLEEVKRVFAQLQGLLIQGTKPR